MVKHFKIFLPLFSIILISLKMDYLPTTAAAVVMQHSIISAIELCRKETKATEADFEALQQKSKPASKVTKCMRACLMKKFNLMDADGKFNGEVALSIVKEFGGIETERVRLATEIVNACITMPVSDDHCEAAEQYGKCASKEAKAMKTRRRELKVSHSALID